MNIAFGELHFGDGGEFHGEGVGTTEEGGRRLKECAAATGRAAFGCLPRPGSLRETALFCAREWSSLRMTGRVALATVRLRRGDEFAEASFGAECALDAFE